MYRVRPRDFDLTIRRHVDLDVDRTLKRRGREDHYRTIRRAIDVEKAFAVEQPETLEIEIEVDLSELYPDD